ncbi:Uncharacterized protein QJS10_CPB17g02344 [Acorus calamus]|uniref:Cell wall hydroxyproline-rich glycoprotein n=1 Tax=Acorus calamus TaxID=4465 RepID=A0AAV9CV74_ACOCL|nr:Uncharacterized protein QJS10_CPB17g02344 [Acorus calamus]
MFKILLFITLLVLLNPNPSISFAPTPHGYHPSPSHGAYPPEDLSPPPLPPPPPPPPSLDPKLETARTVILQFKSTITSDPLGVTNTWVSGTSPCNYTGFFCGNPPKENQTTTIASIDFNGFGLAAPTVSGFLDQFTELALFHANSNNFSGYLPDISNLQYLYELDLSNNKLSGKFPMEVLQITDPVFLDLRYNNFYGVVPPQVFTLPLDVLFINNNAFDNYIPHNLGATTVLYLTLANNHFTGPIPGSIRNLSSTLKEVLFLNNDLTGCLPFQIGYLKSATVFDAGGTASPGRSRAPSAASRASSSSTSRGIFSTGRSPRRCARSRPPSRTYRCPTTTLRSLGRRASRSSGASSTSTRIASPVSRTRSRSPSAMHSWPGPSTAQQRGGPITCPASCLARERPCLRCRLRRRRLPHFRRRTRAC